MKKKLRGFTSVFLVVILLSPLLSACSSKEPPQDIYILYTNDVHCAVDTDIGYAGLSAYKEWILGKTEYVTLVDCGDALQGSTIGTVSQGEYLVDIMNEVGYDFAVPGNHEFDYGMEQLAALLERADAQ